MSEQIHILSLGAGVQSSTLALMAAHGEVGPMPTAAIFADTQAEPASVYAWLEWLERKLPFPVVRVTAGSLTHETLRVKHNRKTGQPYYSNLIPAFTLNADGTRGIVGRRCTYNHKVIPIVKAARKIGKIKRGQKTVGVVQWIGISLDEVQRMKPSREPWSEHRWPLIEMEMTRYDCMRWMEKNGYPTPPRSACVYCPFHSDHEWRRLKRDEPAAFAEAVRVDHELRELHATIKANGKINGGVYLHDSLRPLDQIDFSEDTTQGQFKFGNECEGLCGV